MSELSKLAGTQADEIERLLKLAEAKSMVEDKNPKDKRCPFCHSMFRFDDQVLAHLISKHRKDIIPEILSLRKELAEIKEAMVAYRALARERVPNI